MEPNPYDAVDDTGLALAIVRAGAVYRLVCGLCWGQSRKQSRGLALADAASEFHKAGWRVTGGAAKCPKCVKASR
jgi:hypothetical protein